MQSQVFIRSTCIYSKVTLISYFNSEIVLSASQLPSTISITHKIFHIYFIFLEFQFHLDFPLAT